MQKKLYCLYLVFGESHRESGLKLLREFITRVLPDYETHFVVIDNAIAPEMHRRIDAFTDLISGDNSSREFSGLDRGYRWLASQDPTATDCLFLLANDTFHRSYGAEYLNLFQPKPVKVALSRGQIVGYLDAFPEEIELFDLRIKSWIRSSFFLIRGSELKKVMPLALPRADSEIFSEDWRQFFKEPSPLSNNYRGFLRTWLFGEESKDGSFTEAWHSQKPLSADTFSFFKGKARAIFCEHWLSARAAKFGISIYDVRQPKRASLWRRAASRFARKIRGIQV